MNITRDTTTRRRLLASSLVKSLAIAVLPGAMLVQNVDAGKKKKKGNATGSVSDRTQNQRDICESGGGQLAVLDGPHGGNTTECKGGTDDGFTCYNTKKNTNCHQALTQQPSSPLNDATAPTTGGNEQPHDGGKPAGGGAHVDPGPAEDPGGQASGPIVLFAERNVNSDSRHSDRRRRLRHGKSRQR